MLPNAHLQQMCLVAGKRAAVCLAALSLLLSTGCASKKSKLDMGNLTTKYQSQPLRTVPEYLKGTILERADLANTQPFAVSGFGLVSGLHGTGDSFVGNTVREYMIKQMVTHGFGSRLLGMERVQPETMLRDPNVAIVSVAGFIPPGARKGQKFDVYVSALDGNNTSSLAHGRLYDTELKVLGANVQQPGFAIDTWAKGAGDLFVNPAYALRDPSSDAEARQSLRQAAILGGGRVQMDRPLVLRMRQPSLALSRTIDFRIDQAFQDPSTAAAKDEVMIAMYVPAKYGTDWEHFAQVVMHLYINASPEFAAVRARQLAEEAVKPDAPLLDISYCWEAFGPTVLPYVTPLVNHPKPEVAYAAARAAAFLGDNGAQNALIAMAETDRHPFQESAVQTLSKLPNSPQVNSMLRKLLDSNQNGVRIEAYRALAEREDPSISSREIANPNGGQGFVLDIVPSKASPIIYASRTGTPRVALIGTKMKISTPILFTAMGNRLSISSGENNSLLDIFYRGPELQKPVSIVCPPDADLLVARLGGEGIAGQPRLQFAYCDVVSLLQEMAAQSRLTAQVADGRAPVVFRLQDPPRVEKIIDEAETIPEPDAAVSTAAPISN